LEPILSDQPKVIEKMFYAIVAHGGLMLGSSHGRLMARG
jgi:hypothetical protein